MLRAEPYKNNFKWVDQATVDSYERFPSGGGEFSRKLYQWMCRYDNFMYQVALSRGEKQLFLDNYLGWSITNGANGNSSANRTPSPYEKHLLSLNPQPVDNFGNDFQKYFDQNQRFMKRLQGGY